MAYSKGVSIRQMISNEDGAWLQMICHTDLLIDSSDSSLKRYHSI